MKTSPSRCIGLRKYHRFRKGPICLLCGAINPRMDERRNRTKGRPGKEINNDALAICEALNSK